MSKVKEIQARRTQVRQLSDIGKTTPEIALETGVTTRTVRLDLEAMGIQNDRRTSKDSISLDYSNLTEEQRKNFDKIVDKYIKQIWKNVHNGSVTTITKQIRTYLEIYKTACKVEAQRATAHAKIWSQEEQDITEGLQIVDVISFDGENLLIPEKEWKTLVNFDGVTAKSQEFPSIFYDFCRINRTWPRPGAHETENLWDAFHDAALKFWKIIKMAKKIGKTAKITKKQLFNRASVTFNRAYKYKSSGLTANGDIPSHGRRLHTKNILDSEGNNIIENVATNHEDPSTEAIKAEESWEQ